MNSSRRRLSSAAIGAGLAITIAGAGGLVVLAREARDSSRSSQALSVAKERATSIFIYAADSDDHWPLARLRGRRDALGWGGRIRAYIGSEAPPDEPELGFHVPGDEPKERNAQGWAASFGMNANLAATPTTAELPAPDRSILLFEVSGARSFFDEDDALGRRERLTPVGDGTAGGLRDSLDSPPIARYALGLFPEAVDAGARWRRGSTLAFADGHAGPVRAEAGGAAIPWTFATNAVP